MTQKTVSDAIQYRRAVRTFDPCKPIDTTIVRTCIEQATLAPSSSNMQLWAFYHIVNQEVKS